MQVKGQININAILLYFYLIFKAFKHIKYFRKIGQGKLTSYDHIKRY